MRILALDDQPAAMQLWWNALVREGFSLRPTSTTSEAVLAYNEDHYDLILLDRMMPRGDIFARSDFEFTNDSETDVNTGNDVYLDLRGRNHLGRVPIIILTNYYDPELAARLEAVDERLLVLAKSTRPSELVAIVKDFTARFPVERRSAVIPDDEYPDVAPYFVTDVATGEDVRVYFDRCGWQETEVLEPGPNGCEWDLKPVFEHYLLDEDFSRRVRKMLRLDRPGDRATGLYYSSTGKRDIEWYRDVLCVTAPWNKRDEPDRELRGVGEALIARFLREWLWRHGKLDDEVTLGSAQFDEPGVDVESTTSGIPFIEAIGFARTTSTRYYRISAEQASALLDRVTRRERGPVRKEV